MPAGSYRFKVGTFKCVSLSDGNLNYPLDALFANVATEKVQEVLRRSDMPTEHLNTPYTCLYVKNGQHQVMIDTGAGDLGASAKKVFPTVDNSASVTGTLVQNTKLAGVQPSEIDTVIITHAHPDHIGGTLSANGELVFPSARYFISKTEWEFWTSDAALVKAQKPMVEVARRNLEALEDRLTLIPDEEEVIPGVRALATPGHTPGHLAIALTSGTERLLHISDVVLSPLHLEHPEWRPIFDMLPEEAEKSKGRICRMAADGGALVFAHHFPPFPNLGYISDNGDGWKWQPIEAVMPDCG